MHFVIWMDPRSIRLSEISQRDTHTNTVYFHLHVESTKTKNRNRLIDTENKLIVAREKGDGGSVKEVKGV